MKNPKITTQELKSHLKSIKSRKATGPDDLKGELYEAFAQSDACTTVLKASFQDILDNNKEVPAWKKSKTKMVPKTKKPTVQKLRPIALTDVSYKLHMKIIGSKIDQHILKQQEKMDNQAGFTRGSQIEDNLFTLQYCIDQSYKKRKPLIVTCLDYKKAFDSIKRGKIIEALMYYRIHYKIIDAIATIYKNDYTEVVFGDVMKKIDVTSGIRQGCTGSSVLFKLITYMIMNELDQKGRGYKDENFALKSLFFADDALLLSHSLEEARENLEIITNTSREFGLEINREKSNILIFNMKEQPDELMGIQVVQSIKYLGIEIDNKRNYFKTQREKIIQKARKMANLTHCVIEKSCNKLLIGKTYWKSVALPTILYGTNIVNLTEENIKVLQRIENSVYRTILGAAHYTANATLRGEIGSSLMKRRIINSRFNFIISINTGRNQLLEHTLREIEMDGSTKWIKTTVKYMSETGIHSGKLRTESKADVKKLMYSWDKKLWIEDIESKSSLNIYRRFKTDICEEDIYDNRPSSRILNKARTNTLQLNDRNRHVNKETHCMVCGDVNKKEDIYHFLLHCEKYKAERQHLPDLQQPYIADEDRIIGILLFDRANIEKKKDILYLMWKRRTSLMKTLN